MVGPAILIIHKVYKEMFIVQLCTGFIYSPDSDFIGCHKSGLDIRYSRYLIHPFEYEI